VANPKKRKKLSSGALSQRRSNLIDNPLLKSSVAKPSVIPTVSRGNDRTQNKLASLKSQSNTSGVYMSSDEEKISVMEIITDVERQIEAAFSVKEAQDVEIAKLQDGLAKSQQRALELEAKVKDQLKALISQEELSSELEFLENERLEAAEKIRDMESLADDKDAENKEIQEQFETFKREIAARDTRIEQIELEFNSTNRSIQTFQNQISLLEDEKEDLLIKLSNAETELEEFAVEKEKSKEDLHNAKESLDEIRLMLSDTRSKTRERYYTKKKKPTGPK
jgi:chromosome segregation ATPase